MRVAAEPVQRPRDARLLVVDGAGRISHHPRSALADLLVTGDLLVANDAATLPASLTGRHLATGAAIEVRLAGRRSLELITALYESVETNSDVQIRFKPRKCRLGIAS